MRVAVGREVSGLNGIGGGIVRRGLGFGTGLG